MIGYSHTILTLFLHYSYALATLISDKRFVFPTFCNTFAPYFIIWT